MAGFDRRESMNQDSLNNQTNAMRAPVIGSGWLLVVVFMLAVLLQLPLVLNPGYFSHDELQWAARADVASLSAMPWQDWLAVSDYQYRPLTFNLWLLLSYLLFDSPTWFHGLMVLWGALNAALLFQVARQWQVPWVHSLLAIGFFVTSPYVLYVHGWVATLGDVLVLTSLLLMLLWVKRKGTSTKAWLIGALGTAVALLSKESALSIPAVLGVVWLLQGRQHRWFMATVGAGMVAVAYLALRLPVLLSQPENTHYALSLWHVPWRWLEYHLYWISPHITEPHSTLAKGLKNSTVVAGMLSMAMYIVMWRVHRRFFWALVLGGLAVLGPVLPLAASAAQYGYLLSAWVVLVVAGAWQYSRRTGRVLFMLLGFLSVWHGINTAQMIREVGQVQVVFSPALADILATSEPGQIVRLRLHVDAPAWLFIRLTTGISSYQGVPIGNRMKWVSPHEQADFEVMASGHLAPIP